MRNPINTKTLGLAPKQHRYAVHEKAHHDDAREDGHLEVAEGDAAGLGVARVGDVEAEICEEHADGDDHQGDCHFEAAADLVDGRIPKATCAVDGQRALAEEQIRVGAAAGQGEFAAALPAEVQKGEEEEPRARRVNLKRGGSVAVRRGRGAGGPPASPSR